MNVSTCGLALFAQPVAEGLRGGLSVSEWLITWEYLKGKFWSMNFMDNLNMPSLFDWVKVVIYE